MSLRYRKGIGEIVFDVFNYTFLALLIVVML